MIKKLKLGLASASLIGALAMAGTAFATASPLTFSNDTTINIPAVGNFTILAGSGATSIIVDTGTLTVTTDGNNAFTLYSPDRFVMTNSATIAQACTATSNTVVVPISTTSLVFTPTAAFCPFQGGSGGLSSGTDTSSGSSGGSTSSGGGSSSTPVTLTITPVSVTPTTATISGCNNGTAGFSIVTGQSCSGNTVTVTTTTPVSIAGCGSGTNGFSTVSGMSCAGNSGSVTTTTSYNFGTVTLKNGSKGNAVMELQRFLNTFLNLGLVVDGKLGPKTIAVIKKWQLSKGLVADGLIGPKTKAMMNTEAAGS